MTLSVPRLDAWLNLSMLRLLVGIAEQGSLSASARAAGVAQSNASRSLKTLERRLGYPLINRSTQGSTLTRQGALTAQWARDVLAATDRLSAGAEALANTGTEELAIGTSMTIAEHLLPEWIASFRSQYPGNMVKLQVMNSAQVIRAVNAATVALGFVETPEVPKELNSVDVWQDELVVVADPTHPWALRSEPIDVDELAATPLVEREEGSGTRAFADLRIGADRPAPILELNSNAAICETVIQGIGPALLSGLAVESYLEAGQLVQIPVRGRTLDRTLSVIWSSGMTLSAAARRFLETARKGAEIPSF